MSTLAPAAGRPRRAWRGQLFGLSVHSTVALEGCRPGLASPGRPATTIEPVARDELAGSLPGRGRPIAWRTLRSGARRPDVLQLGGAGYLLPGPGYGLFHVSASGAQVSAAPNRLPPWRWQRYLLGRVLPFAAVLRGLEPLHAAAVSDGGGVILLAGEPGVGKSSLTAGLLLAGLELVADDVVALSLEAGAVVAHPGPGLVSVERRMLERLTAGRPAALGRALGRQDGWLRVAVAAAREPGPVRAVIFLERGPAGRPARAPLPARADPTALLASTFNSVLLQRGRLERQLDVCARLARDAQVLRLAVPAGGDPRALAERILAGSGAA